MISTDYVEATKLVARAFDVLSKQTQVSAEAILPEAFYCLAMALVRLKKVPGGKDAHDQFYQAAKAELARRKGIQHGKEEI